MGEGAKLIEALDFAVGSIGPAHSMEYLQARQAISEEMAQLRAEVAALQNRDALVARLIAAGQARDEAQAALREATDLIRRVSEWDGSAECTRDWCHHHLDRLSARGVQQEKR